MINLLRFDMIGKETNKIMRFWFSGILVFFCLFLTWNLAALDWDLVNEEFDKDFGALTKVEHTGPDRTAEMGDGVGVLKRAAAAADIGPTIRVYFDDPGTNEFIVYAKIDAKELDDTSHFIIAMRISGFEYFPTVSIDKIGDHETAEQWNTGISEQQVDASPTGVHEYIIVGKSADAYDLYFDGKLIIKDGITRSLGGEEWEVAQLMIHVRQGTNTEIHVDALRAKRGTDGLNQITAVSSKDKLASTWAEIKEQ